jgi:hypothetical protein
VAEHHDFGINDSTTWSMLKLAALARERLEAFEPSCTKGRRAFDWT